MFPLKTLTAAPNEKKILQYILRSGQATRQDLVEALGLTLLTISKAVSLLLEQGLLMVDGTVSGGMGRRKSLLKLNPAHRLVIGVDIGYSTIKLGLIQFDGTLLEKRVLPGYENPIKEGIPYADMMENLADLIARAGADRLLGIGASISGMVDYEAGRVLFCPNIAGFDDRPLAEELSEATELPVSLDTSARCMALGESSFGAGVGVRDQVFLSLGAGSIAAGILCDGRLYRGADGFAGEIGHNRAHLPDADAQRCSCGGIGCLELYATESMALKRTEQALSRYAGFSPARNLMRGDPLTAGIMAEAYRQGDQIVVEQVEAIAGAVGSALGALVNLINPSLLALGGGFAWRFPALCERIEAETYRACLTPVRSRLSIRRSSLGEDAPLLGSAMQLIRHYLN